MNRMRRLASWIDLFVSLVAAILLGTFAIAFYVGALEGADAAFRHRRMPIVYAGVFLAVLLLLGAALRVIQIVARATRRRYIHFETQGGRVSISAAAVEGVINRSVRAIEEIADASSVLVIPKDSDLPSEIRLRCRLYDRPNVLAIQSQVRAAVAQRYQEMFPGDEPAPPVQVSVENIVFETPGPKTPPKPEPEAASEEPAEEQPFRPQYPVEQ